MPSTYSTRLRFELQATGENRSTWGNKLNVDLNLVEASIAGWVSVAMGDANVVLSTANAATDQARMAMITLTGANTAIRNVTIPTVSKNYIFRNATTGGFAVNTTNGSSSVSVPAGGWVPVWTDGTTVFTNPNISAANLTGTVASGAISGSYPGITGVGALTVGSIASGFGNINIGASTLTAGASTLASLTVSGISAHTGASTFASTATFTGMVTFNGEYTVTDDRVLYSSASSTNFQNGNNSVNFLKKSGGGGYAWVRNTTGLVGGAGQTTIFNVDDSGNGTFTGSISMGQNISSTTAALVMGPASAGAIYFRPYGVGNSTNDATLGTDGMFRPLGVVAGGTLLNGSASYQSNGDVNGSVWGSWGNNSAFLAIQARIEARGAAYADSRRDQCVTASRMAGYVETNVGNGQSITWGAYVFVYARKYDSDSYAFGARQPQLYIPNVGWFAAFPF